MDRFIKSKSYKKYLASNGISLNDIQWLKIINRAYLFPLQERLDAMEQIKNRTEDNALREKIQDYLGWCKHILELIYSNHPDAVYHLEEIDPNDSWIYSPVGVYKDIRTAEKIGAVTNNGFRITRHRIADISEDCFEKNDEGICRTDDLSLEYLAGGKLRYFFYHSWLEPVEEVDIEEYLSSVYSEFPFDGSNGMYISVTEENEKSYGIYHDFPDHKQHIEKIIKQGLVPDEELLVETMDEDGEFGHQHLLPTEFEVLESVYEIPEEKRALLICASELVKGQGTIDSFQYILQAYKRKLREIK